MKQDPKLSIEQEFELAKLAALKWRENNQCFSRPQAKRSGQQDLMLVIWGDS